MLNFLLCVVLFSAWFRAGFCALSDGYWVWWAYYICVIIVWII